MKDTKEHEGKNSKSLMVLNFLMVRKRVNHEGHEEARRKELKALIASYFLMVQRECKP